jgi:hypothetical protein
VVKVDDVVLLELGAHQQIPDDASIVRDLYTNSAFYCPHRGQVVGVSSDPAGTLGKQWCIPGIPSLQDNFNTPEHLTGAPGVDDFASRHLHLNAQVALYPCNRIDGDSLSHYV